MTKKIKYITLVAILLFSVKGYGQNTTNSPYSQFGLGDIQPMLTPQSLGMGGISVGLRKLAGFNTIHVANPASYSAINLTTFDIGASLDFRKMSKSDLSQRTTNGTLSHLLFAVPVSTKSALSFGLMPYTDLGYQYRTQLILNSDTIDHVFAGEGGLSRAHVGYGYQISKKLSVGVNLAYIFGDLKLKQSTEFPKDPYALSSRTQYEKSVGGLNYQYGLQYLVNPDAKNKLVIGYSGGNTSGMKTNGSITTFHYSYNAVTNAESAPIDTTFYNANAVTRLKMPQTHTIGFSLENTNKWLIGADLNYSNWSSFAEDGVNQGLKDSYGFAVGGQYTPDVTSVSNYLKLIDYRLGFKYDNTYITVNDQQIKQYALCVGLGIPLPANRTTFYKINFSAELGKRGSLENNLIKENYLNLHLGFTLNDRWFIKTKYD